MLDWLLHPLAIFLFLLAAAALNLWLFFSVKVENAAAAASAERRARTLESVLGELRLRIEALESRPVAEPEPVEVVCAPPPADLPPGDLNVTRRAQALRLARRGETPARIAAQLGIPANEVELLLKVQGILTESL